MRKTVSGLVKLVYPHGEFTKDELAELVELGLEGRRRVKEQLKKMGVGQQLDTTDPVFFSDPMTAAVKALGIT